MELFMAPPPLIKERVLASLFQLLIFLFTYLAGFCHIIKCSAQVSGFVSIDCGSASSMIYNDSLGIEWTPDMNLIREGETANVGMPVGHNEKRYGSIRYFEGNQSKYCYVVEDSVTKGSFYLVRAAFWIGQDWNVYETQNHGDGTLEFKLIIDAYEAADIVISLPQVSPLEKEIYMQAQNGSIVVCLSGSGAPSSNAPFISSLEVRPLVETMHPMATINSTGSALLNIFRVNYGAPKGLPAVRYQEDRIDRIWFSNTNLEAISTNQSIIVGVKDIPPMEVVQTAYTGNSSWITGFQFNYSIGIRANKKYFYALYFAEIDSKVNAPGLRVFNVLIDGVSVSSDPIDVYNVMGGPFKTYEHFGTFITFFDYTVFNYKPTSTSKYLPFISALEIFQALDSPMTTGTFDGDVAALNRIKASFPKLSTYTGDPCLPQNYNYPWLNCTTTDSSRVTSILLSSYRLVGEIPASLNDLTSLTAIMLNDNSLTGSIPNFSALMSLKVLDLSNNNLSGLIPESLSNLASLETLFLQNNNLSGDVPESLLKLKINYAGNPHLCKEGNAACPPVEPSGSTTSTGRKSNSNVGRIFRIVVAVLIISIVFALGIAFLWLKKRRNRQSEPHRKSKPNVQTGGHSVLGMTQVRQVLKAAQAFTSRQIEAATNNYSTRLGGGGFGQVYQGTLPDGCLVAVKVLSEVSEKGIKEFLNEVCLLTTTHHKNLVQMLGYCTEGNLMLVYEYMSRGSLLDCLHGGEARNAPLTWRTRLQILIDVATGLDYLHHGCRPQIIHRDVKSSNVLLSGETMEAKVADLGISRLRNNTSTQTATSLMGTLGYLDPEYASTLVLTEKVDVYSFGVLLLEVVCGRFPIISIAPGRETNIVDWVRPLVNRAQIQDIVDVNIAEGYNVSAAWRVVDIGMRCVEFKSADRPLMDEVCMELKGSMHLEMMGDHLMTSFEEPYMECTPSDLYIDLQAR